MSVSSRASVDLPEPGFADDRQRPADLERERHAGERLDGRRRLGKRRARRHSRATSARASSAALTRPASCTAAARGRLRERRVAKRCAELRTRAARRGAAASLEGEGAARREQAAARPVELAGHDAGDGGQPPLGRALRQGGEQRRGIGMVGIGEERARRVRLHLLAGVLDDHAIGGLGDDPHVVGDQHQPHAVVAA